MKVAFLDRDGVINIDTGYVYRINDFKYTYKCKEALRNITDNGYKIIIITNQSGIGRGYFSETEYKKLTSYYLNDFKNNGIDILDIFYCPHHVEANVKKFRKDCNFRKPKPGMIKKAIKRYSIDINNSFLVGDKLSDIEAGMSAGINNLFLIENDNESTETRSTLCKFKNLYSLSISEFFGK